MNPEPDAQAPPETRVWRRYLWIPGVLLITGLVFYFGWRDLAAAVQAARPTELILMTVLILVGFWVRAWKWHYALGPGKQGVALFFVAKMAGNWTPGRAGEFAPLLIRTHRTAQIAAWILADRILEIYLTLTFGIAGLFVLNVLPDVVVIALFAGWLISGAVALALLKRFGGGRGNRGTAAAGWRGRVQGALRTLESEFTALGPRALPIFAATMIAKTTDIYAVILLCKAFGYYASFLLVCAARCSHALVSAIPVTPDATGVPFVAAAYVLHEYTAMPYATLAVALGIEVAIINVVLWCSCLVGARPLVAGRSSGGASRSDG